MAVRIVQTTHYFSEKRLFAYGEYKKSKHWELSGSRWAAEKVNPILPTDKVFHFGTPDSLHTACKEGFNVFHTMTDIREAIKVFGRNYLNYNGIIVPAKKVKQIARSKGWGSYFVKPAIHEKNFEGAVYNCFCENCLESFSCRNESMLCLVAKAVEPPTECVRFYVVNNKVVDATYREDLNAISASKVEKWIEKGSGCAVMCKLGEFANKMAKKLPFECRNLSLDVGLYKNRPVVVEVNSLHSTGISFSHSRLIPALAADLEENGHTVQEGKRLYR